MAIFSRVVAFFVIIIINFFFKFLPVVKDI